MSRNWPNRGPLLSCPDPGLRASLEVGRCGLNPPWAGQEVLFPRESRLWHRGARRNNLTEPPSLAACTPTLYSRAGTAPHRCTCSNTAARLCPCVHPEAVLRAPEAMSELQWPCGLVLPDPADGVCLQTCNTAPASKKTLWSFPQ